MTSHRTISLILTLLAVLATGAPSSAFANPLLSGYGAPGEGNQAILGSALLGGAGGGTGGGGSSGGHPRSSGTSPSGAAGTGTQAAQSNGAPSRNGQASGGGARAYPVSSGNSTSQPASAAAERLGVSGEAIAYILLVLAALAFTGVVTRRLTRASRLEGL